MEASSFSLSFNLTYNGIWFLDVIGLHMQFHVSTQVVANYMGEGVALIDSGAESAKAIIKTLTETGGLAETDAKAEVNYYCSARLNDFETIAQVFLNKDIHGSAFEINIEEY